MLEYLVPSLVGLLSAVIVALINNKNADRKFKVLFNNHLHGLSQYLKVLNSAMLKKNVIDEIDKQRLDNEADNICGK